MGILTLITTLVPVLLTLLGSEGVISPSLTSLVTKLSAVIASLVADLVNGGTVTSDTLAILKAINTEVDNLKSSGAVFTLNTGNIINALDLAIADALTAFNNSKLIDDPSNLVPLPENL